MSKSNNRASLMGLKTALPAVPRVAPVALTVEMEEQILGASVSKAVHKDVKDDVPASARKDPAPRRKEAAVLMNAKIPASLHARLKRTAQFNDISMTDILIRAIEAELDSGPYAAPPQTWGSDMTDER